jgi:ligand-binding sensor domain-containing protein
LLFDDTNDLHWFTGEGGGVFEGNTICRLYLRGVRMILTWIEIAMVEA